MGVEILRSAQDDKASMVVKGKRKRFAQQTSFSFL